MNDHLFVYVWRAPIPLGPNPINEVLHLGQGDSTFPHGFFPLTPLLSSDKRRIRSS